MSKRERILVIHGPNLDLLGTREVDVYGKVTLNQINRELRKAAKAKKVELTIFQSDHEGQIVKRIGKAKKEYDAILINPAAYTHTSIAIRDAVSAVGILTIEVHLSNISSREDFRHISLIAPVCVGQISGFGLNSYLMGLEAAIALIRK